MLVVALCLIAWVALSPEPPKPSRIFGWDKANHALAFFVLAGLGYFSVIHREWLAWGLIAGYGLAIELCQGYLGYRNFELTDMLANCVGIGLFVLCIPVLLGLPIFKALKHPKGIKS